MSKATGGPAFPTLARMGVVKDGPAEGNKFHEYVDEGMTLRDYFAIRAAISLIQYASDEDRAKRAYQFADAMLAERLK